MPPQHCSHTVGTSVSKCYLASLQLGAISFSTGCGKLCYASLLTLAMPHTTLNCTCTVTRAVMRPTCVQYQMLCYVPHRALTFAVFSEGEELVEEKQLALKCLEENAAEDSD